VFPHLICFCRVPERILLSNHAARENKRIKKTAFTRSDRIFTTAKRSKIIPPPSRLNPKSLPSLDTSNSEDEQQNENIIPQRLQDEQPEAVPRQPQDNVSQECFTSPVATPSTANEALLRPRRPLSPLPPMRASFLQSSPLNSEGKFRKCFFFALLNLLNYEMKYDTIQNE